RTVPRFAPGVVVTGRETRRDALPVLQPRQPRRAPILREMWGRARRALRVVWRFEPARRAVLRRLWRPADDRGAGERPLDARRRAGAGAAGRRTPAADGPLLRPGRLDAALAAARRRGVARPHRAVPAGRLRRRRALRRPRRPETRRWPPHLLRLAYRVRGRPGTGGPGRPRDRGRPGATPRHAPHRRPC